MVKHISTSLLSICLLTTGKAQQNKFELGVQGGMNRSFRHNDHIPKEYKASGTGLSIGVHGKYNFSNRFGLKMLLNYDRYSYKYQNLVLENNLFNGTTTEIIYKLTYLNIPLVAEYSFGNKLRINVNGGALTGILLSNKSTTNLISASGSQTASEVSEDRYRKMTFGLSGGAGIQYPISSKMKLGIEARDNFSLTKLNKPEVNNGTKLNALTFLATVSFQL